VEAKVYREAKVIEEMANNLIENYEVLEKNKK